MQSKFLNCWLSIVTLNCRDLQAIKCYCAHGFKSHLPFTCKQNVIEHVAPFSACVTPEDKELGVLSRVVLYFRFSPLGVNF